MNNCMSMLCFSYLEDCEIKCPRPDIDKVDLDLQGHRENLHLLLVIARSINHFKGVVSINQINKSYKKLLLFTNCKYFA